MTAGDLKLTTLASAILLASVCINLFWLQEKSATSRIETRAVTARTFEATVGAALADAGKQQNVGPVIAPGASPPRGPVSKPNQTANATPLQPSANTASAGEIIRGVQRELNTRGYEAGQPDGVAGLVTRAAIMAYEYDYGLPLTAEATPDLLRRIVLGSSAAAATRHGANDVATDEAQAVARSVEQQLAGLGYTPGPIDGKLDERAARAIREFEVDQKLAESGRISGPLVSRLIRMQGTASIKPAAKTKSAQK